MDKSRIKLQGVKKSFGEDIDKHWVLRGIDVEFQQGLSYAVTGVSGTGKSTLMHLIAGLDSPTKGSVFFNDNDVAVLSKKRSAFLGSFVGLVFQSPYLISELSVEENVMLPAYIAGKKKKEAQQAALSLLDTVGLFDKKNDHPSSLSGGQQQRVSLARALINRPSFLIADEPTGNLDVSTGMQMIDLLLVCQKKWEMGIIVTSHDSYVAKSMNRVFELKDGLIRPSKL